MTFFVLIPGRSIWVYTVFVASFLWTFVFAASSFGIGGWIGAVVLGVLAFNSGIKVHYRDLKRPLEAGFEWFDTTQWRQNLYLGGQNLN